MERKEKEKEISGWYTQKQRSPEEMAAETRATEKWHEKKHILNYRSVPLEIPGKMMLALGKMALGKGMDFSQFIEEILDGYLRQKRINWKARWVLWTASCRRGRRNWVC